jgi:uncharacterized protein YbjT (DUF2867 family)
MNLRVILTGATGLVGEGVLLECLQNPAVERVLAVSRRSCGVVHPKLTECLVADFTKLDTVEQQLTGYDACFYCAGISSSGLSEEQYTRITYDTPLHFAQVLLRLNPQMVFCHVSGSQTDSSEKGRMMWARVKGKAENALMRMPFKRVHNFRPGFMKPTEGQKNVKPYYRVIGSLYPLMQLLLPSQVITMREVGLAMIHSVQRDDAKQVLEVRDIKALAAA